MNNPIFADATFESLQKIFTVPESSDSTLAQIDREISNNLLGFLQDRIVTVEKELAEIEKDFSLSQIPEQPSYVSRHTEFLLDKLVAHSVHTASPSFIGHMTSALPYFMIPLSKIMIALNQNLVKIETSKAFTPLERQVIGMMHHLTYNAEDFFYKKTMHQQEQVLGAFCSCGTIANITALWTARNNAFPITENFSGIQRTGWFGTLRHHNYEGAAVLVSERGHYSLSKAADILGIGRENIISIPTDDQYKIDLSALQQKCDELQHNKIKIIALVGIAGTTETGSIDPLNKLADIAEGIGCHFHIDAAWGGPTLFSSKYRELLQGIERADSVIIDAHKQMYVPMGASLVVFRDPTSAQSIQHHAQYIIREGSKDLGAASLEGSRPGMAMLVHAALHIMGRRGYELLIDRSIAKAHYFANLIEQADDFELTSKPELNILTYRYVPAKIRDMLSAPDCDYQRINQLLDQLTIHIQKTQRERGKSFVSRTRLLDIKHDHAPIVVFRTVMANPLTTEENLYQILMEQRAIAQEPTSRAMLAPLLTA